MSMMTRQQTLGVESLERRDVPAVSAVFGNGILTVFGGSAANLIEITDQGDDGTIEVFSNGQPVVVVGSVQPTEANTSQIRVSAGAGDDTVTVAAEVDLAFPSALVSLTGGSGNDVLAVYGPDRANLNGQDGDDLLQGGAGNDSLFGGTGNDSLYGGVGSDQLFGQDGDDALFGGDGDDSLYGQEGDDSLYGQAGDDRLDGGAGLDWLYGGAGDDLFFDGEQQFDP